MRLLVVHSLQLGVQVGPNPPRCAKRQQEAQQIILVLLGQCKKRVAGTLCLAPVKGDGCVPSSKLGQLGCFG